MHTQLLHTAPHCMAGLIVEKANGQMTAELLCFMLGLQGHVGKQRMQAKEAVRAKACDICVCLQNLVQAQTSLVFR